MDSAVCRASMSHVSILSYYSQTTKNANVIDLPNIYFGEFHPKTSGAYTEFITCHMAEEKDRSRRSSATAADGMQGKREREIRI
jgi:hypothetical protein